MRQVWYFLLTILPGFTGVFSFFSTSLTNIQKGIIALTFSTVYFLGLVIYSQVKLKKAQKDFTTVDTELSDLNIEKKESDILIGKYAKFVHNRKLFLEHDLHELGALITEFEGIVKNSVRGQKYQEVRIVAGNVKNRSKEIINKEKRDFNEQLYNIQGDKNN